jgi:hypothetical protein
MGWLHCTTPGATTCVECGSLSPYCTRPTSPILLHLVHAFVLLSLLCGHFGCCLALWTFWLLLCTFLSCSFFNLHLSWVQSASYVSDIMQGGSIFSFLMMTSISWIWFHFIQEKSETSVPEDTLIIHQSEKWLYHSLNPGVTPSKI